MGIENEYRRGYKLDVIDKNTELKQDQDNVGDIDHATYSVINMDNDGTEIKDMSHTRKSTREELDEMLVGENMEDNKEEEKKPELGQEDTAMGQQDENHVSEKPS